MKNIELYRHGVRTFYSKKGCHACYSCKHLCCVKNYYSCPRYNSAKRQNFPFDNTSCKEFKDCNEQ